VHQRGVALVGGSEQRDQRLVPIMSRAIGRHLGSETRPPFRQIYEALAVHRCGEHRRSQRRLIVANQ
jgi:hypothetical protein